MREKGIFKGVVITLIVLAFFVEITKLNGGRDNIDQVSVSPVHNLNVISMKEVFEKRKSSVLDEDKKVVLDEVFAISDRIITDGMSDKDKVRAIHDYLIYNADYYNDGDLTNAPSWVYSAKGVLLEGEGVCNSYALAFHMLAEAAGLSCHMVSGVVKHDDGSTGDHAWNRVCVNQEWYYIDCTWDDPVGQGTGYERYDYYLSRDLWENHMVEEEYSIFDRDMNYWNLYYLTGERF